MAEEFKISKILKNQGWKVKVRDKERNEGPHVSIMFKTKTWRLNLRDKTIMDTSPPEREIPKELLEEIKKDKKFQEIVECWNKMYPENKV